MYLPSCGTVFEPHRHRTRGQHHVLGFQGLLRAVRAGHQRPCCRGRSRPWPWMPTTPFALNSASDAAGHGLDDGCAALLHRSQIELQIADLDAVHGKLVLGAMIELRGLEQRLGGNAAGIQAGAAEGIAAVAVLPLVDAGHFELVLRGSDRRRITRGTGADDDDVDTISLICRAPCAPDLPEPA